MPNVSSAVRFKYGNQSSYDSSSKDTNSVYFANDSRRLFVGAEEYSRPVERGTEIPSTSTVPQSLYVRDVAGTSSVPAHAELYYNETGESSDWILLTFESVGSVRYDMIQSLSDDEKGRARTNIGAASEEDLILHSTSKDNPHGVTADQVGADPEGTAASAVESHNTNNSSHNDIRLLISDLVTKLNNFLDVDDTTSDQLSEVLELINNNKGTLESLTTSKVNVTDIVDNLTTPSADKILSANQGVVIKSLVDTLQSELNSLSDQVSDIENGAISVDTTLSVEGMAADSKTVGTRVANLEEDKVSYSDGPVFSSEEDSESYPDVLNADTLGGHPASDFAPAGEYATKDELNDLIYADVYAAPAGYGLGVGSAWIADDIEIDTLTLPGWYSYGEGNISSNKPFVLGDIFVLARGSAATCIQVATSRSGSDLDMKTRKMTSNIWGDWEYINPPMTVGIEYRTIEWYNGEPVYVKQLDIGALPNASRVVLGSLSFPNRKTLISVAGVAIKTGGQTIPFPYKAGTTQYGDVDLVAYPTGTQSITGYITTTTDMSEYTGVLTFKYTKSVN